MNNLTIVLMTCGEITEKTCLWAIESFRHKVEFFEVRNVTPQIKALNQMVDRVETDFFIPLDADMVLYHNAYGRIRNALLRNQDKENWHSILFPLWDTLTQRNILALKILRTEIMKKYPFEESATPDVQHFQKLTDAGYDCVNDYLETKPIGNHVVMGHHFCYHKYRDLYQTYRCHDFEWDSGAFFGGYDLKSRAKLHYDYFFKQWVETENPDYLSSIAGMMDGILSPVENRSKDLSEREYIFEGDKSILGKFLEWYQKDHPKYHYKDPILL